MSVSATAAATSLPPRAFICLRCQWSNRVSSSYRPSTRPASTIATSNVSPDGRPTRRRPTASNKTWLRAAHPMEQARFISRTLSRRDTIALMNPRKDEQGNEMAIDITSRASKRLHEIMQREKDPSLMLRIQVTSGGCHGFQYLMSLESSKSSIPNSSAPPTSTSTPTTTTTSIIQPSPQSDPAPPSAPSPNESSEEGEKGASGISEDDTIFQATDGTEAKVVMDEPSLELLKGSKVDYSTELIGSQFRIADNPRAKSSCGCGTSFDVAE